MMVEEILNRCREKIGRPILYACISGSHMWGLNTPESDLDIRGVYLESPSSLMGLFPPSDTVEFTQGTVDGQFYEAGKFFRMLAKGNGNMVRLLNCPEALVLYADQRVPWQDMGKAYLSKQLRFYYRGYADGQRKRALSNRGGKALLYTYREMFEGIALMVTGEIIHDFNKLCAFIFDGTYYEGRLLHKVLKNKGWFPATPDVWNEFYAEWENLCFVLDRVAATSSLPDTLPGHKKVAEILANLYLAQYRLEQESLPLQDLTGDYSTQFPFPPAHPPDVLPEKGE